LLAKKLNIKKDYGLTPEKILADVTTNANLRNKSRVILVKKSIQFKTEIVMEENGKTLSVLRSHLGRTHDFRIRKQEKP